MSSSHRANITLAVVGEGVWGINQGLVQPFTVLVVLLQQSGAGAAMIGAVGAVQTGCTLFPQVLGAYLFVSRRTRQRQLLLWHYVAIVPFLFISGAACFHADRLHPLVFRLILLAGFAGFYLGVGVCNAAWTDWLASLFPVHIRGTVLGAAMSAAALFAAGSSVAAGKYLERYGSPENYGWLYLTAGLIACVSLMFYAFIKDATANTEHNRSRQTTSELLAKFRLSLDDRNFRALLIGRLLSTAGFGIVPFIAVYYASERGGRLSPDWLVSLGAAMSIGIAFGNLVLGRLGDIAGHRAGILTGVLAQITTLLILLTTSGKLSCLATYFLTGIYIASTFISHYNMLFETCPHDHRFAHITVGNLVLGVGTLLSPLFAGLIAQSLGLQFLFVMSLTFSLAALSWFLLRTREPREQLK